MEADLSRSRGSRLRSAWSILGFCNMVNHVARLLSGLLLGLLIPHFNATLVIQDERQTGASNVDARLKNVVFVLADPSDSGLINKLVIGGLHLSDLATFPRVASKTEASEISETPGTSEASGTSEKPSEATVYETENAKGGKEPYRVEIVRIEKEKEAPSRSESTEKPKASSNADEKEPEQEKSSVDLEVGLDPVVSMFSRSGKTMRRLWGSEESHDPERKSKQWVDEVPGKNFEQSDELEVKEALHVKPGISLKKQLSTKQEKEEEEDVLSVEERNELGSKFQELVLLGGGIENCGPGRFRDRKGICQHDENFQ